MKYLLSLVISVALVLASTKAYARAPQRPGEPPKYYATQIEIDVSKLGISPGGAFEVEEARRAIDSEFVDPLRAKHALPSATSNTEVATLTVAVGKEDFDKMMFKVKITATVPGAKPVSEVFTFVGEEYELAQRLQQEIPKILVWLQRPTPTANETAEPQNEQPQPYEAAQTPLSDTPRPSLNSHQRIGLGLGVAGLVVIIPSAILLSSRGSETTREGPSGKTRDLRPALGALGITGALVGSALFLSGLGLFIHGRRASKKTSSARIVPVLSPTHSGVLFETRF